MGVDRHHAVDVQRVGDVDVADSGVRVRRPDERHLEGAGAGADVVGVAAVAGDQPEILDAADGCADVPGDHYCCRPCSFGVGAVRRPAARHRRCSDTRCSDTGFRRSSRPPRPGWVPDWPPGTAVTVVRKPGVQNPHCSAWHSWNARCTGESLTAPAGFRLAGQPLHRGDLAARPPTPRRSGRTGPGHRPAARCRRRTRRARSRHGCRSGPRSCRRKSDSVRRAATVADRVRPLTVSVTSCSDSPLFGRLRHAAAHCLPRSRDRLPGSANGQHTGQMPAVVGGGVQVGLRIDGRRERVLGGVVLAGSARPRVRSSTSGVSETDRYPQRSERTDPSSSSSSAIAPTPQSA